MTIYIIVCILISHFSLVKSKTNFQAWVIVSQKSLLGVFICLEKYTIWSSLTWNLIKLNCWTRVGLAKLKRSFQVVFSSRTNKQLWVWFYTQRTLSSIYYHTRVGYNCKIRPPSHSHYLWLQIQLGY